MNKTYLSAFAPTALFVVLWSSGAIASEIAIRDASPIATLIIRYAVALTALALLAAIARRSWLPEKSSLKRVMSVGLLMAGFYSVCYLFALEYGVTPGALATLLGIQPILTLFITGSRMTFIRVSGLAISLAGLVFVVSGGLRSMNFSYSGVFFAALALVGMTWASVIQKKETQPPLAVLPMQYTAGLVFACAALPLGEFRVMWTLDFALASLWLGLVVSVGSVVVLYRLIDAGDLVNVTSLFYLVPGVTAVMDWLFLGNILSPLSIVGLLLTVLGIGMVFHDPEKAS